VGVRSVVLVQIQTGFKCTYTPKYHAADKHDTPHSHVVLAPC